MKKETKQKEKTVVTKELIEGLQQSFTLKNGKSTTIQKALSSKDVWQTNGRVKRTILTHDAVKKLADMAGISRAPEYSVLTQPSAMNNYQYTMQVRICSESGKNCVTEIGEANRSNLGSKGRGNPANMAQKRAYDRAVLRFLGITGMLSEEELTDNEEDNDKMEGLSHEERKSLAPMLNQLLLVKNNQEMILFSRQMKEKAKTFLPVQLDYMRKMYKKKVGLLTATKF